MAAMLLAVLLIATIGLFLLYRHVGQLQGESATVGGSFRLTDTQGRTVTDRDFRGHFLLVYFGYTFCPDICPTTLATVTQALARMGPAGAKIQPLFITVDPRRDTPAVIGRYLAAFSPRLVGLTGSQPETDKVEAAYHVVVRPGATPGAIDHSAVLYFMGPNGRFLTALSVGESAATLAASLSQFVRQD
jgi:protein SCO1/2